MRAYKYKEESAAKRNNVVQRKKAKNHQNQHLVFEIRTGEPIFSQRRVEQTIVADFDKKV